MGFTLAQLAEHVGGEVVGDASVSISSAATLPLATAGQISFLTSPNYKSYLTTTQASAVIVKEAEPGVNNTNLLVARDPYLAYAKIARLLYPATPSDGEIHPSAYIARGCTIPASVSIGPNAVIEEGVELGEGVCIRANVFVGRNARIGEGSLIYPNVSIMHEVEIGKRCIIHPGAVIGSDGFGYAFTGKEWLKIPQIGTVVLGNDVEIGASTAIDRGALENTIIDDGVKLDNQIHIAHNVRIGANTVAAAGCGIAGSTVIGANCMLAGKVAIAGHLELGDNVVITGHSTVTKTIREAGSYSSAFPVDPSPLWRRNVARFRRFEKLINRVAVCEQKLEINKD